MSDKTKTPMLERRDFAFEVRAAEDKPLQIVGHAAVFNTITDIGGWFREQIAPGAFADSIKTDDIRALFNHDSNHVLGRNKAGTLRLSEDEKGLYFEVDLADTQFNRDLYTSIQRGDISQCSFGFMPTVTEWLSVPDETDLRTIKKCQLFDVSPVTFPAYPTTDASVRSAEQVWSQRATERDEIEKKPDPTDDQQGLDALAQARRERERRERTLALKMKTH